MLALRFVNIILLRSAEIFDAIFGRCNNEISPNSLRSNMSRFLLHQVQRFGASQSASLCELASWAPIAWVTLSNQHRPTDSLLGCDSIISLGIITKSRQTRFAQTMSRFLLFQQQRFGASQSTSLCELVSWAPIACVALSNQHRPTDLLLGCDSIIHCKSQCSPSR